MKKDIRLQNIILCLKSSTELATQQIQFKQEIDGIFDSAEVKQRFNYSISRLKSYAKKTFV